MAPPDLTSGNCPTPNRCATGLSFGSSPTMWAPMSGSAGNPLPLTLACARAALPPIQLSHRTLSSERPCEERAKQMQRRGKRNG